ncbi:MAG: serine hydrolase [Firmicutes bacterium]|nr:serine hydrolase [Bacillota bacterium]
MKKNITKITTLLLIFLIAASSHVTASASGKEPQIAGTSAIIYIGDTGETLWQKDSTQRMQPASMTKLLTCLIAAENLDLDKVIEISYEATLPEPTKMYLQPGEKITVKDLMYATLLESANDGAEALAIATAGSVDAFAVMMNEKAEALGCTGSNFVNPSGLPDENHYSTAKDMAIIAYAAMQNKTVRDVAGTAEYTISATNAYEARSLFNYNLFLKGGEIRTGEYDISVEAYEGVVGGKTGVIDMDNCTMVTVLDYDGIEICSVVMGTDFENRYSDIKMLMDYGKTGISKYTAFEKGQEFGKAGLTGGAKNKVKVVAADNGYVNLPEGASASLVTVKCKYSDQITAPVQKGQKVGVAEIYIADELYKSVDLIADENVEKGWFLSDFGISNMQTVIIFSVIFVIAGSAIAILAARASNRRKRAKIRKARLEEEARRQLEREEDLKRRNWPY